ncbi:MAG: hypothetical protein R3C01_05540 [Planctomycetaceae bacterium]
MSATTTTDQATHWLTCLIYKGMFSDEVVISYPSTGEPVFSDFVPSDRVSGEPGTIGRVKVRVFERNGKQIAILPTCYSDSVLAAPQDLVKL